MVLVSIVESMHAHGIRKDVRRRWGAEIDFPLADDGKQRTNDGLNDLASDGTDQWRAVAHYHVSSR